MSLTASVTYDREKNRFDFDDFFKTIADAEQEQVTEAKQKFKDQELRFSTTLPVQYDPQNQP